MTTEKDKIERRALCIEHQGKTKSLWKTVEGNGKKGLKEKVIELKTLMYIVIALLLGNGGLMAYTLKFISSLKK